MCVQPSDLLTIALQECTQSRWHLSHLYGTTVRVAQYALRPVVATDDDESFFLSYIEHIVSRVFFCRLTSFCISSRRPSAGPD